jgi:hypothetical protein
MTTTLVEELVSDQLWQLVNLCCHPRPGPYGGRRRTVPDRACVAAGSRICQGADALA